MNTQNTIVLLAVSMIAATHGAPVATALEKISKIPSPPSPPAPPLPSPAPVPPPSVGDDSSDGSGDDSSGSTSSDDSSGSSGKVNPLITDGSTKSSPTTAAPLTTQLATTRDPTTVASTIRASSESGATGGRCSGSTFSGKQPSTLSAVEVARVWLSATGDHNMCVSAVSIAYGESAQQKGDNEGSGCKGGIDGKCFPTDAGSGTVGLWQISGDSAENPLYSVGQGCDTADSLPNPCCNALKAHKIVEYTCIANADQSWAGDPIDGARPFCSGQWTGAKDNGSDYYADNNGNAEQACSLAAAQLN